MTWSAATQLPFPSTFHPGSETIPSFNVSGLYPFYDSRDTLHIVASVNPVVVRNPDSVAYVVPAEIWHWSVATGWRLVARAACDTMHLAGSVGFDAVYATRPTIGEGAAGEFVCVWEEFDSLNVETGTGMLRADIWGARSTDGGATWGTRTRITDANQTSKRFPCIASSMKDDTCLVCYLVDQTAGSAVLGQGAATSNPVVVQWVPKTAFRVPSTGPDVGVATITAPVGTIPLGTAVVPACSVYNYGTTTATYDVRMTVGALYDNTASVSGHSPGTSRYVTFPTWPAAPPGNQAVIASTNLTGDVDPDNDTAQGTCTVLPGSARGWTALACFPPGSKGVKTGAWLAYDAGTGRIYATRGNKTGDFYAYDPAGDSWKTLSPMPGGTEGKLPSAGAAGCADGSGMVFATKGNNSTGFFKYTAALDSWRQLADVPLGLSNKKVKGGTDVQFIHKGDTGFVYLLKGYKAEYYRYNTLLDSWQSLPDVPGTPKCDKGSFLADDGTGLLYAHKAKYHEMNAFNAATGTWGAALKGMPFIGSLGKSKKSKDGGCGTWLAGALYALKGGNTQEFWKYLASGDSWHELETMPQVAPGSTKKKKVKAGADIAAVPGRNALYATKGNNTLEFFRYDPGVFAAKPGPGRGIAGTSPSARFPALNLRVAPNPLRGMAGVSYELPAAGTAVLRLFSATGALVADLSLSAATAGEHAARIDASQLPSGVYLLRLECAGLRATRKLVVE